MEVNKNLVGQLNEAIQKLATKTNLDVFLPGVVNVTHYVPILLYNFTNDSTVYLGVEVKADSTVKVLSVLMPTSYFLTAANFIAGLKLQPLKADDMGGFAGFENEIYLVYLDLEGTPGRMMMIIKRKGYF